MTVISSEPLVLYSATTQLAYNLAIKYYRDEHYVWCAPAPSSDRFGFVNPPSSDPIALYWRYRRDVNAGDEHSSQIANNRRGLARGASVRESQGYIDAGQRSLIEQIAEKAPLGDFAPLLFVIPFHKVRTTAVVADIADKARVSSQEFIIEKLCRDCFDVLRLDEG